MFGEPNVVEAQFLAPDHLVQLIVDDLLGLSPGRKLKEKKGSEFHTAFVPGIPGAHPLLGVGRRGSVNGKS